MWSISNTTAELSGPKTMNPYEKGQEFGYMEARRIYGEHTPEMGIGHKPTTKEIAEVIYSEGIKTLEIEVPKGSSDDFVKGVESYVELLKLNVKKVRIDAETAPTIIKVEFE